MTTAIAAVLVGVGVALQLFAVLGVVLVRDPFDRIHFAGVAPLAVLALAAAVWVAEGPSLIALKATLAAALLVVSSPVLSHVLARAAHRTEAHR